MKRILLLLFVWNIIIQTVLSQIYDFSRLANSDGLSNNQIEVIFKDSRGFMWFATNSGLNRYDGQSFKIYRPDKSDPQSISTDKITSIQEDASGNLWLFNRILKYEVYNPDIESFFSNSDSILATYGLPPNPQLIKFCSEKDIYACYGDTGIYWYNNKTKAVKHFSQEENNPKTFSDGEIEKIDVSDKHLWVLFKNGLLERLNKETQMVDYRNTYFRDQAHNSTIVKSIMIDSDDDLWLYPGVADKGAAFLNMKTYEWQFLDKESTGLLSNSFVRCIVQDKKGLFWIGTDHGGINIFDKHKNTTTVLNNDIYDDNSISQNSIISEFCDNDGIVWVGTYKNGISYYHPNMFKFRKPELFYQFRRAAKTFDCNSLYKDQNDNLWIGTNGSGLIKYNEQNHKTENFRHNINDSHSISSDIITSIISDHRQTIWIGTFLGGINAFDGKSFRRYQIDENNPNSLSSRSVYGISEDKDNNLWIGTLGGGINRLDDSRLIFTRYNTLNEPNLLSDFILSIFRNNKEDIYFCTDRGLNIINCKEQMNPVFNQLVLSDSLSSAICNNTVMDRRGLLWIATDNGINVYNPETNAFNYINSKNGIPDEDIVSSVEDHNGHIWAGTRNGLVYIECSYASKKLEYTLTYFDTKDGLPSAVCNLNAAFKDRTGQIYIGTTKGYVSFNPDKISFNKMAPKPRFTELLISNQVIRPNVKYKGRVILKRSIIDINEITLKYNETNFTLAFSAMNYIHPEKNQYRYKLKGLDKDWTTTKKGLGTVSYSNLNPGTYNLIIYASNDDGIWSENPLVMKIVVTPPLWLSWWAYLIYFILILLVVWLFTKYKLNKQETEFKQTQKVLEAEKMHEVDELKFKFFTNISHEFKTPITLILTPVDKLLKNPANEEQKNLLNIIRRNATNLLNMVNEILEFRKLDLNKVGLNLVKNDIICFIRDICNSFTTLAAQKDIRFTFTSYLDKLFIEFDPDKMNKIIVNLISNAFKFTEEGEVNISVGINEEIGSDKKNILIKIADTGIGIEKKYLNKIFDRFFRIETQHKENPSGTGVGLHLVSEYVKMHGGEVIVESEPDKGSVFTVTIPIVDNLEINKLDSLDTTNFSEKEVGTDISKKIDNHADLSNKANLPLLLIVDDNEDFRDFITELFFDSYRVITAEDGQEAFSLVMDQLPDIILCDVMMPKMDGYEFCRKVKGDVRTSHIPVILLTAKSSDENRYSGIEAGADDYIAKPFNIDLLTLKISKIVEKQRCIQQKFKHKIDISPSEIEITSMDEAFVKKAVALVEQNIDNPEFLVEDLCKEMAMSRVYFYKKILALTGKTPSEFIRFIRMKRAADLLEKSQLFVNEIAYKVGFNDPKYFRKYFKDEFGIAPNEYKKQNTK